MTVFCAHSGKQKQRGKNTLQIGVEFQESGIVSRYLWAFQSRNPSPSQGYPQIASTPWSILELITVNKSRLTKLFERHLLNPELVKFESTSSAYAGGAGPPLEEGLEAFTAWFVEFPEGGTSFLLALALCEEWALWEAVVPLADDCDWAALLLASLPPLQASLLSRAL